jgi:hypothetical protein
VWWARLSEPLLCRLGFHKWRNYGNEVEVFWQEPTALKGGVKDSFGTSVGSPKGNIEAHSKVVYEGRECARCGMKLRRKFVTNSDGILSCVGWEPDTEETDKGR